MESLAYNIGLVVYSAGGWHQPIGPTPCQPDDRQRPHRRFGMGAILSAGRAPSTSPGHISFPGRRQDATAPI